MKAMIKKAVVMLGMVTMSATGSHAETISTGTDVVTFYTNGDLNWISENGKCYRVYDKILFFRTEAMVNPATLISLPQSQSTFPAANRLIRTFSDPAGQFRVTLDQSINSSQSPTPNGRSALKSTIKVENVTAAPLKFHLYERSTYAIKGYFDTPMDNVAVIGNRAFFSNFYDIPLGSPPKGAMVTKAFTIDDASQSALPPTGFAITARDSVIWGGTVPPINPTLTSTDWPMPQNGKPMLDLQWTLDIPANGSFSFAITDDLLPAYPMNATLSHTPACSGKNQQVTYTINLDNYANMTTDTNTTAENVKVFTVLPEQVSFVSATNNGVYDPIKRTVTWNINSMAPQSSKQTMQVTVLNPTDQNVTLSVIPSSNNLYPSIVADTAESCLNTAPTFVTPTIPYKVTIGMPYSYQVKAVDANGDKVSYSLDCGSAGCPAGLKIDQNTGVINWQPTDGNLINTDISFSINASDHREGAPTTQGAVLGVRNSVPLYESGVRPSVYVGNSVTYQVTATDEDGHALTYSFPSAVPAGMTISGTGLISFTPTISQAGNGVGKVYVKVRYSDSWAARDVSVPFEVVNPISITSTPSLSVKAGTTYTYQVIAANRLGKSLNYTLVGPTGMTITNTGLVSWTPTSLQTGPFSVTVKVSDGVAEKSQTFTVTPDVSYFVSKPVTQATVGQQYIYSVVLGNVDQVNNPAGCMLSRYPGGMTSEGIDPYVPGSARIIWTPTAAGQNYNVTIDCVDKKLNMLQQSFTITVNP